MQGGKRHQAKRATPLKDLLICLGGDDAVYGALRAAVRAEDRHAGAKLAAEREGLGRPKEVIHFPRALHGRLVLEQQIEAPRNLVRPLQKKIISLSEKCEITSFASVCVLSAILVSKHLCCIGASKCIGAVC